MKDSQFNVFRVIGDFVHASAAIGEKVRAALLGAIRARSVSQIAAFGDGVGSNVVEPAEVAFALQVSAFVKKNEDLETPDCRARAYDAFLASEKKCRITNRRLTYYYLHPGRLDPELAVLIGRMRRIIARVLGDSKVFIREIPSRLTVTPGATASLPRRSALPVLKLGRSIDVPSRAIPYVEALRRFYGYEAPRFRAHEWNRVEFVPKSFKTKRTIAAEPTGVLPLQLCVDSWLKDRLRRVGVDLSNQERNQYLARKGSIDGSLATIDLSAASDSVSLDLIHLLFPEEWAKILCDFRSPFGIVKDGQGTEQLIRYAKFASMGNGSTFVVESLIFFSVLKAIYGSSEIAVYGDDMICPVDRIETVFKLLRFLGFSVNSEKSFWTGPYRESCGAHWCSGEDVRPFFVRRNPTTRGDWCHLINGLVQIGLGTQMAPFLSRVIKEQGLPLVPYNQDTRSGVFITPTEARERGLIRATGRRGRWSEWIPVFKGILTTELEEPVCSDSRALFLWHLRAGKRRGQEPDPIAEKYRLRPGLRRERDQWLAYWPCHTPAHLYGWNEGIPL